MQTLDIENIKCRSIRPINLILKCVVQHLLIIASVGLFPIQAAYSAEITLAWDSSDWCNRLLSALWIGKRVIRCQERCWSGD